MGQGRIRKIVDYQSKSGERSRYRVAKKPDYNFLTGVFMLEAV